MSPGLEPQEFPGDGEPDAAAKDAPSDQMAWVGSGGVDKLANRAGPFLFQVPFGGPDMLNQERLDAGRELLAALGSQTSGHQPGCSCHRCGCWNAMHDWLRCETGQKPCMCGQIQKSLAHEQAKKERAEPGYDHGKADPRLLEDR